MKDELNNAEDGIEQEKSLAEQEFINYCEANEIAYAEEDMDDESRADFAKIKKRFMKAVNAKRLVIDGTKLTYTVSKFSEGAAGDKLIISRPIGKDFIAMDGMKETQAMSKFNAFIASISGKEKSYIAKLDVLDRQFLQDIGTLFLTA